jgi:hypothetical protein
MKIAVCCVDCHNCFDALINEEVVKCPKCGAMQCLITKFPVIPERMDA